MPAILHSERVYSFVIVTSLHSDVFFADYDRIIKNIERGEARISRKDEIMKAIGKKLDRYKNPWLELKIQYGQNKGKLYNEECDRFMVRLQLFVVTLLFPSSGYLIFCCLDRYAWFTSLDMETGMNLRLLFALLHCFVLIGLWSHGPHKNLPGGVIL